MVAVSTRWLFASGPRACDENNCTVDLLIARTQEIGLVVCGAYAGAGPFSET